MAVTDASLLIHLIDGNAEFATDDEGGQVQYVQERITGLIEDLAKRRERLLIPTPVLAEVMVRTQEAADEMLAILKGYRVFRIADFDAKAALECSLMTAKAIDDGDKKSGSNEPWQLVKIDRQLAAIASANNQTQIYTGDARLTKFLQMHGMTVTTIADLPLPESARQAKLDLGNEQEHDSDSKSD